LASQADDAALGRLLRRAVNKHHAEQSVVDGNQADHAGLLIVHSLVMPQQSGFPLKPGCIQQGNAMLCQIRGIFGRVERHIHLLL